MALLGLVDYDGSDLSDSSEDGAPTETVEESAAAVQQQEAVPPPFHLPKPRLSKKSKRKNKNSVFSNPFEEERDAEMKKLEKHVKMRDFEEEKRKLQAFKKEKPRSRVCVQFLHGTCRYGDRCRMSHDVESAKKAGGPAKPRMTKSAPKLNEEQLTQKRPNVSLAERLLPKPPRNRKRPGVTNELKPPKRAMGPLKAMRAEERPWTVNKEDT